MVDSIYSAITNVEQSQSQKEVTINEGFDRISAMVAATLTQSITSADFTPTSANPTPQWQGNFRFVLTGTPGVPRLMICPVGGAFCKLFIVQNDADDQVTIQVGAGPSGTTVVLAAGVKSILYSDGTNITDENPGGTTAFLGLTDTPSSYAGQALQGVRVNSAATALEFASVTGGVSSSIPPFKGCRVRDASIQALTLATDNAINWDTEDFDTDVFHDTVTNNTRITIPAGVTKVILSANLELSTPSSGTIHAWFRKDGAGASPGWGGQSEGGAITGDDLMSMTTGVIEVAAGDFFEVMVNPSVTGQLEFSEASSFSVVAVESSASGSGVGRPQFMGARIRRTTAWTLGNNRVITWETAQYDTDTFFTGGAGTRLTIPNGLGITKVRLHTSIWFDTLAAAGLVFVAIRKNGTIDANGAVQSYEGTSADDPAANLTTGVVNVVDGDWFDVFANSTDPSWNVTAPAHVVFSIEVVETTGTAYEEHQDFTGGVPATTTILERFLIGKVMTFPVALATSQGHAGTAPNAQTDFDLQKNGVSFGTMRFANAATVATFIAATATSVSPGDRIDVISPANLNTLADLSFNIRAEL